MPKYVAEIFVSDDTDWKTIEDAKLNAQWRRIVTLEERMARTDLNGKCGSCMYFGECNLYSKAYGECKVKGSLKERSQKACKTFYKKKEN
jgi:hypothetical protein